MSEEDADLLVFDKDRGTVTPVHQPPRGVLPWPSWNWQRGGFFVSILLGLILLSKFPEWYMLFGTLLLTSVIYGGVKTNWLNRVDGASPTVRASCGFATLCGLVSIAIALAIAALFAIALWIIFSIIGGLLSSSG